EEPAYAGLDRLCAPLRHHLANLTPEQARVLGGALGWAAPVDTDPFGVGAALVGLLAAGAADRGLVVVVDDADFLDRASLDALVFAAGRLRTEGVVLLLAARPDGPGDTAFASIAHLRLRGIDDDAGRELL